MAHTPSTSEFTRSSTREVTTCRPAQTLQLHQMFDLNFPQMGKLYTFFSYSYPSGSPRFYMPSYARPSMVCQGHHDGHHDGHHYGVECK